MSGIYYFDVLPLHPRPKPLESLTSYLTRLAVANQLRSMWQLLCLCFPNEKFPRLTMHNGDFPPVSFGALATLAHCSEADLLALTFSHLGQKFGRPPYAWNLTLFLSGVVADHLRYCPLCLAEHGYYRLTWRFLTIEGCDEHGCRLLDRCDHCGQPVPFLTYRPQVGICPGCGGDLRTCPIQLLAELPCAQDKSRTSDFEYLLQPQASERLGEQLIGLIGDQLARWREHQGLSIVSVARAMKQYPPIISNLETGSRRRGLGFRQYLKYADFLQIRLRDIFETAAPGPSPARSYEEKTLAKIRQAVVNLEQQGQRVTQIKVKQMIGASMAIFTKYPQIKAFWAEYRARARSSREQALLNQVQQAIDCLKQQGQPVTQVAVSQLVGRNLVGLRCWPRVWAASIGGHSEVGSGPPVCPRRNSGDQSRLYRREAELVYKVRQAIEQLQREGKVVSQYAIAARVGLSTDGLIYYPQVRAILRANKAEPPHREEALLARVREVVADLEASQARLSRTAVARQVGLTVCSLTYYPRIKSFLTEQVSRYQQRRISQRQQRETELLRQIQQGIDLLSASGDCMTQKAIGELVGVSVTHLRQYPRIKSLLQQVTQPRGSIR